MAVPQEKYYTIEDIYNLSDKTHAELIDGKIYYMSPPSRKHQDLVMELSYLIRDYFKKKKGNCRVYPAPFAVFLNQDDSIYLEPDLSIICDRSKLDDRGCNGAPDWIIEVVSPNNPSHDYMLKLNKYAAAGVREYWIVDPRTEHVQVYFFESTDFPITYSFKDTIKVNIYDDFSIDFAELEIE